MDRYPQDEWPWPRTGVRPPGSPGDLFISPPRVGHAFLRSPMIRLRCMVGAPNIAIATPPARIQLGDRTRHRHITRPCRPLCCQRRSVGRSRSKSRSSAADQVPGTRATRRRRAYFLDGYDGSFDGNGNTLRRSPADDGRRPRTSTDRTRQVSLLCGSEGCPSPSGFRPGIWSDPGSMVIA